MTIDQFFTAWNNKGLDADKVYKFQCVDVFLQYDHDVVGGPSTRGNAIDYWTKYPTDFFDRIANNPNNFPQKGDVVIWGTGVGKNGHIAVCSSANADSFVSFDQNWPLNIDKDGNGLGVCHFQAHNYNSVLGWLRPKVVQSPSTNTTQPPVFDPNLIPLNVCIINIYRALCGVDPSPDEITARMIEYSTGKPISSIMEDVIRGDIRFKARWIDPAIIAQPIAQPVFSNPIAQTLYSIAKSLG